MQNTKVGDSALTSRDSSRNCIFRRVVAQWQNSNWLKRSTSQKERRVVSQRSTLSCRYHRKKSMGAEKRSISLTRMGAERFVTRNSYFLYPSPWPGRTRSKHRIYFSSCVCLTDRCPWIESNAECHGTKSNWRGDFSDDFPSRRRQQWRDRICRVP